MQSKSAISVFAAWYDSLPVRKDTGGPARGTVGAALAVLDHLKDQYDLDLEAHRAPGGSQVRGASGAAVRRILAYFGETRPFLSEGGRTNRGALGAIGQMLQAMAQTSLENLPPSDRNATLTELQQFLVEKVGEYHSRQRLTILYDPAKSTRQFIEELLSVAREHGKEGPVAQYLVGAKLQLRFPDVGIRNGSFSTADVQTGEPGDFKIGDTVFHVTVAPMLPVFEKCSSNLDQGLRVYLLVPERSAVGARQNVEGIIPGRIGIESIESFVGQNLDELGSFSNSGLEQELLSLLQMYNQRVDAVEVDKSMLIEIPQNLL